MQKEKKCRQSSNKISFYIVGNSRLENELIAFYLKHKTGNECVVLEDINHIPKGDSKNNSRERLVFWNCRTKELNNLLAELKAYNLYKPSANHIVLFNVPTNIEVNKKFFVEGIHGFFYEHDSLDNFMKGVLAVIEGKLWLSREMMTKCVFEGINSNGLSETIGKKLTERQIEILALIAVGNTNDEIAEKLYISPHTVKSHLYSIFKKINVPNRIQAALWAAKNL